MNGNGSNFDRTLTNNHAIAAWYPSNSFEKFPIRCGFSPHSKGSAKNCSFPRMAVLNIRNETWGYPVFLYYNNLKKQRIKKWCTRVCHKFLSEFCCKLWGKSLWNNPGFSALLRRATSWFTCDACHGTIPNRCFIMENPMKMDRI